MNGIEILTGDCRETLKTLPDNSVHCVVTSPPYFGLRNYGTGEWAGGDKDCDHVVGEIRTRGNLAAWSAVNAAGGGHAVPEKLQERDTCPKCGAIRIDAQIGLEATPDEFVAEMVGVFREVRRVLRDDGTCWVNLGDSYASSPTGRDSTTSGLEGGKQTQHEGGKRQNKVVGDLKPKDLIGIPWMVAFALRTDGWWLRQDIIWHKPNPMPESVTDRCTKSHEYLFLLTKSARYYFDAVAIQEQSITNDNRRPYGSQGAWDMDGRDESKRPNGKPRTSQPKGSFNGKTEAMAETGQNTFRAVTETRNKRSIWTVSTKSYKGAHFATFPPDLIEPCILAGTSEHGCCPDCGSPWERITETTFIPQQDVCEEKRNKGSNKGIDETSGLSDTPRGSNSTKTTGWKPTCKCGPELEPVPCTVLDPFNGSGTTGEVARNCGCHYIGCELNPDYVKLTKKRLKQGSLLV